MGEKLKKYVIVTFGSMLAAFAAAVFYTPNKIVSGGASGLATVLFYSYKIPLGISFALFNIFPLIIARIVLGKKFVTDTIYGAMIFTIFAQVFSYVRPITDDLFLSAIFGAVLYGSGIGMVLAVGASTGGMDIVCRLIQYFFTYAKAGTVLFLVDTFIIVIAVLTFRQVDLAMYGILALATSSFCINTLISKLNISKLAFIITDSGEEISKKLVSTSPRGVTLIKATGAYTMVEKNVLLCALKEREIEDFQNKILEIDPTAFIIFSESYQIVGNGFRVYK